MTQKSLIYLDTIVKGVVRFQPLQKLLLADIRTELGKDKDVH